MGKCLITKFNEAVDNNSLRTMDEMVIHIKKYTGNLDGSGVNQELSIENVYKEGKSLKIIIEGDGGMAKSYEDIINGNTVKELTGVGHIYLTNGDYYVHIYNKSIISGITVGGGGYNTIIPIRLEEINNMPYLESLMVPYRAEGKVTDIINCKNIKKLTLGGKDVTLDIDWLNGLDLTRFGLMGGLALDVTNFNQPNLKEYTGGYVFGDLTNLLKNITQSTLLLSTGGYDTTCDASQIGNNVNYTEFNMPGTNKWTWETERSSEAYILCFNKQIDFGDYVDAMLINQAKCQKGRLNSISCIGNRTSASDAAIETLQSKGVTVTIYDGSI